MNVQNVVKHLPGASRQAVPSYHAPFRISRHFAPAHRHLHLRAAAAPCFPFLACKQLPSSRIARQVRCESTQVPHHPAVDSDESTKTKRSQEAEAIAARKAQEPSYELTFTCRKCIHRSTHRVSKQAYHFGTTLITCPGCKNRHLISDHLRIFSDTGITIEDILKEKGELLKKGRLGDDGDIEFYDENNEIGQMLADQKRDGNLPEG